VVAPLAACTSRMASATVSAPVPPALLTPDTGRAAAAAGRDHQPVGRRAVAAEDRAHVEDAGAGVVADHGERVADTSASEIDEVAADQAALDSEVARRSAGERSDCVRGCDSHCRAM